MSTMMLVADGNHVRQVRPNSEQRAASSEQRAASERAQCEPFTAMLLLSLSEYKENRIIVVKESFPNSRGGLQSLYLSLHSVEAVAQAN